jgi:hypothetical protein
MRISLMIYLLSLPLFMGCGTSSSDCDQSSVLTSPCYSQEYGQCDAPKEHLNILFKPKDIIHPFSHSFCIVCNPDIAPQEYEAWALDMGAPQGPDNTNDVHPCLYVYSSQIEINSLDECQSIVCDGGATYNDMVGKGNGNIDVSPILQ